MQTKQNRRQQKMPTAKPQTLAELLGDGRLLVEHHRGILSYGTEEILVGTTFGYLRVCGEELRLCCMSREQLWIAGSIRTIHSERCG